MSAVPSTRAVQRLVCGAAHAITDAGLETELIFTHRVDLPCFAAFAALPASRHLFLAYYSDFLVHLRVLRRRVMAREGAGGPGDIVAMLDTPTWRASVDWLREIRAASGDPSAANEEALVAALEEVQREAVAVVRQAAIEVFGSEQWEALVVVSGSIGPRGDGYVTGGRMSVQQARAYHSVQVEQLKRAGAHMINALTLTYPEEALGLALAARAVQLPVSINFTVEKSDGLLPCGTSLEHAIAAVDAGCDGYVSFFGINCSHPTHVSPPPPAPDPAPWVRRLCMVRVNASEKSHAELDNAAELDSGDAHALAHAVAQLSSEYTSLRVFGGCCGTSFEHVAAIASAVLLHHAADDKPHALH